MKKNGKRYRQLHKGKKTNNRIRIPAPYPCPRCGERYLHYLSDRTSGKGILVGEYIFEGLFDTNYGESYICHTCNHRWNVRKSKKTLLVKLLPFLENK